MSEQMSPAERIAYTLYEVLVPRLYMQTAEAANFYGSPYQDNPLAQKEQEQGDMRCNLPVTKLAELHARGCSPWFVRVERTAEMYQSLVEYLRQAHQHFENNPTSQRFTDKFMEDLLKLENFAQWLFGVAQPYLPKETTEPKNTLSGWRRRTPIARESPAQQAARAEAAPAQEHVRVVDEMLERRVAQQRRGWR